MTHSALPVLAADQPLSDAGNTQLLLAAVLAIAAVVVLIVWAKFHPFIALMLGTGVLGAVAAVAPLDVLHAFVDGLGTTFGTVGLLIALGAMLGKLLADSGGANEIVDRIVERVGPTRLPWAMALIAGIIGLPMFFEIGVVILVPIIILVGLRTRISLMRIGIPALAGLSVLHGLVPPHPGPVTAIDLLHADLGRTLIFGLIVAVPTLIVAGPLLAQFLDKLVPIYATEERAAALTGLGDRSPASVGSAPAGAGGPGTTRGVGDPARASGGVGETAEESSAAGTPAARPLRRPPFAAAVLTMVLPVFLMLLKAVADLTAHEGGKVRDTLDFIGDPSMALLIGVLVAMVALGATSGMSRERVQESLGSGLPGVASIMLIVAAGGGFKTVLSDSGVANVIADAAKHSSLSPLLLGWLVAVGVRLATGSATVATVTTAGIVGGLGADLSTSHLSLLVLAIGSGSLFFSHVNDAGFWLVKEYFGLTVGQTLKSWSVMETVISVMGLLCVLLLSVIV
ncbi:GntP family permease [Nocardioides pocheonensis]|uniref:Gluconate transporter n=1 Tax=Nocardioides pocheonensis TaxID=661485 RepID=A0A3N0GY21_9ACTN|nr:SLC13 family permease [Nocardioides pocheonensis]RNM16982.1 gluconate transporter [Nocardioides pocheonensis]